MKATLLLLFSFWHLGAMVVAPMPDCYFKRLITPVYAPYLALFHIGSEWGFFAPDPGRGVEMSFLVTDVMGTEHHLAFSKNLTRSSGTYMRYISLHDNLFAQKPPYIADAASHVCRQYASLTPKSVQFEFGLAAIVLPDDYLAGARPMDASVLQRTRSDVFPCSAL